MIDPVALTDDLASLVETLTEDLRARCDSVPSVDAPLRAEWSDARSAGRTDRTYEDWREDRLVNAAVAWVLACVFVRFCEDNDLIYLRLSGSGDRLGRARDRYTVHVTEHPSHNQRDYLLAIFEEMAALHATARLYDHHNPLWRVQLSADGAKQLLEFWWWTTDAGDLVHDFRDERLDTRFLGDLYQDISKEVRERYALLQTPEFVESFILDRTLDPAIDDFGLDEVTLIDPACGSGHFLLGAFDRLYHRWRTTEPATNPIEHARRALAAVAGVDLNPYAVAIARFRLLVAALKACGITRLSEAPDFALNVAGGDSLLHGPKLGQLFDESTVATAEGFAHLYETEDRELLAAILGRRYHVVVGNPPYIQGSDKAARAQYKARYSTCHGKWAMSVPFFERFFDLALTQSSDQAPAGYVGMITANSFMKREFGSKLVEKFLPTVDITTIIDTSGAYIPGHGTPTIIVIGRHRAPVGARVRAVMGLRGEPSTPPVPAEAKVWTAIVDQVDQPGSVSTWVESLDWPRSRLHQHPMVFGGGAELWFRLSETQRRRSLGECVRSIGFHAISGEDEIFFGWPASAIKRLALKPSRTFVPGETVRDWFVDSSECAIFPYDSRLDCCLDPSVERVLWRVRRNLELGLMFGKTRAERGLQWSEYVTLSRERDREPLSIAFAFVATHNHFVLDRGGKVFNRSAPVIKLPAGSSEDDHLELLGPLNSSVGCFLMKQVSHNKGDSTDQRGARVIGIEKWIDSYEFAGTQLKSFPLPDGSALEWARRLDELAQELGSYLPGAVAGSTVPTRAALLDARSRAEHIRAEMVAVQEELDWRCLYLYGLTDEDLSLPPDAVPPIERGQRAFEIVLARRMKAGAESTTWFERHGSTPVTELPDHWPAEYREHVERRIEVIESDPAGVGFVERPEFKRRWNWPDWDELQSSALRVWLLDRLESVELWSRPEVVTVARLAQAARQVEGFVEVAHLYAGSEDADLTALVGELVAGEGVPYLAAWRLKESGMRKRAQWEHVWELQRREDAIDARTMLPPDHPDRLSEEEATEAKQREVGAIPKPPAYTSGDFRSSVVWGLRGKLDVPKERFVTYPGAEAPDGDTSAVVGWAGWDHLGQARALAGLFQHRRQQGCDPKDVLQPLLAGVCELVPWVKQWHNEPDAHGRRAGDQLELFVDSQARAFGWTIDHLRAWRPPEPTKGRRRSRS